MPESKPLQFVAVGNVIMRGPEWIANVCSASMAKRIARALNLHPTDKRGV